MALSLERRDAFADRHDGPREAEIAEMLQTVGAGSLEELVERTVPKSIRLGRPLALDAPLGEHELLARARELARENRVLRSFLGMGYSDCLTPPVIQRNVLENPGWYTAYTPYQAEVAQGRLEALLDYQTMVIDLTGLEVANASLLDEATAAAEAMTMLFAAAGHDRARPFAVAADCHPQTIDVLRTRAEPLGIEVVVADAEATDFARRPFGLLLQYPATDGAVRDHRALIARAHEAQALVVMAADPLALALLTPPGELGADVAVGSTQRFGVPLGWGGPHAAYFATRKEHVRRMPGRIIGVSHDAHGRPALRMALQTREQHIRREKATSNICTAQVLLAVIAGMYAVYHGPEGIRAIARRVHALAATLAAGARRLGLELEHEHFFDTVRIEASPGEVEGWMQAALAQRMNLRRLGPSSLGIALDEATEPADVARLLGVLAGGEVDFTVEEVAARARECLPDGLVRTSEYMTHPVFHAHRSETEMLRYLRRLESRDLSLVHSMIPLGSCTMKLNATAEMMPVTMEGFSRLHPFAPLDQAAGYLRVIDELGAWLREITGFAAISFQPNAGSQGEYAGLLCIRRHHQRRGQGHRDVCLIPESAHGTNPASAAMAGMRVVVVACDARGNVDLVDLERKTAEHRDRLAALMITYPSTYGVFEEEVKRVCAIVHEAGGQVYMDGANMNAQVGLTRPADIGADVCHLNLHKTFCIPHGGGGPGMGPIGVAAHLAPFLPGHPVLPVGGGDALGAVSAAPYGSASILLISWAYIAMMGGEGLKRATAIAILNANYVARRLEGDYPLLYRGREGFVAHECILDPRPLKKSAGIEVEDIAKRLMDFGFHAPTVSFPVPGTIMVEPTESESKEELDRFCEALAAIREEARAVERGELPRDDNPLKGAPHTAEAVAAVEWKHPYSREQAAFPAPWVRRAKFWPSVGRIDNPAGDRSLVCACPPIEEWA